MTKKLGFTLGVALAVTLSIGVLTKLVPRPHVATAVGLAFLAATWWLVWRRPDDEVERHALGLGGLMLGPPLALRPLAKSAARALAWAAGLFALVLVPYWVGWRLWFHPDARFQLAIDARDFSGYVLGQVLLIALPEEAFYRGWLQTELDEISPPRVQLAGAKIGPGLVVASAIFAIGHVITIPVPARLAVFFPSLLFGWLRARTGGIGAGVAFHAMCNVYSELLGRAYGVY